MYLKHLPIRKVFEFLSQIKEPDAPSIINYDNSKDDIVVKLELINITFHISDFDCVDTTNNVSYFKQWYTFMINTLNKIDKKLANNYINDFHDHLEQDTIYGPTKQ